MAAIEMRGQPAGGLGVTISRASGSGLTFYDVQRKMAATTARGPRVGRRAQCDMQCWA